MYSGPLVFSQGMDSLSMKTFRRCVDRYQGNFGIKQFTCLDQFRAMAFAQETYRESLRDIEACIRSQTYKLYHMGIRAKVSRSTLAETNENAIGAFTPIWLTVTSPWLANSIRTKTSVSN